MGGYCLILILAKSVPWNSIFFLLFMCRIAFFPFYTWVCIVSLRLGLCSGACLEYTLTFLFIDIHTVNADLPLIRYYLHTSDYKIFKHGNKLNFWILKTKTITKRLGFFCFFLLVFWDILQFGFTLTCTPSWINVFKVSVTPTKHLLLSVNKMSKRIISTDGLCFAHSFTSFKQ